MLNVFYLMVSIYTCKCIMLCILVVDLRHAWESIKKKDHNNINLPPAKTKNRCCVSLVVVVTLCVYFSVQIGSCDHAGSLCSFQYLVVIEHCRCLEHVYK